MEPQSGRIRKDLLIVLIIFVISISLITGTLFFSAKIYDYKLKYLEKRVSDLESETNADKNTSLRTAAAELGQLQDLKDFWKIQGADPKFADLLKTIGENSDKYFVVYFFHPSNCEKACKDQSFIIDYVQLKNKGKVTSIDIDIGVKNDFVSGKMQEFGIKNTAVVMNGEISDNFVPAKIFEGKIANFYAEKFAIIVIDNIKAEENKKTSLELFDKFAGAGLPITFGVLPKAEFNFCDDSELRDKLNSPFDAEIAQQSSAEVIKTDYAELSRCLGRPQKTFVDFNTITPDVQASLLNLNFENIITTNDYYANKRDAFGLFRIAATTGFNENATKIAENCALFAKETELCVVHVQVSDFAENKTTKSAYTDELVAGLSKLKASGVSFVTASEYRHIKEARKWN